MIINLAAWGGHVRCLVHEAVERAERPPGRSAKHPREEVLEGEKVAEGRGSELDSALGRMAEGVLTAATGTEHAAASNIFSTATPPTQGRTKAAPNDRTTDGTEMVRAPGFEPGLQAWEA